MCIWSTLILELFPEAGGGKKYGLILDNYHPFIDLIVSQIPKQLTRFLSTFNSSKLTTTRSFRTSWISLERGLVNIFQYVSVNFNQSQAKDDVPPLYCLQKNHTQNQLVLNWLINSAKSLQLEKDFFRS